MRRRKHRDHDLDSLPILPILEGIQENSRQGNPEIISAEFRDLG